MNTTNVVITNPELVNMGYHFAKGVVNYVFGFWAIWMAIAILLTAILNVVPYVNPRDSTDAATGPRSGLKVYVDHQTGREYLATRAGVLTPRLPR